MARPKKYESEVILKLLTNTFKSTNKICEEGRNRGLYPRWGSYKLALDELIKKDKVEMVEVPGNQKTQRLWRLKN